MTTVGATQAAITSCANLSTVGTITTGIWNGTAIESAYMASATDSAKGAVELATTAETTTGTDAGRAVTPDGLKDGYQGSTNVTTLGTIATGVWQGTAITASYIAAAQTNITSLGTLTALTVDDIVLNGKTLRITGDTDDTFSMITGAAGATTLTTTDDAGADGHFEIAADGDIILDSAGCIDFEPGTGFCTLTNTTASASNTGGSLNLISNDGAALGDDHRLGKIGFQAAEDGSSTLRQGASIEAYADAAWSASENGTRLEFYTMDGNNTSELSLTLDSDKLATFAGNLTISGDTLTFNSHIGRRVCFPFRGYGTADGTNYEAPEILSDTNSPFEHNTSYGSDGLTAQEPRQFMKSGAIVMPHAGKLINWTGWATSAGSGTIDMSLFKATLT